PQAMQVPVITTEQFNQAADISRLAADHDMINLSLRAIKQALQGGPPVVVSQDNNRGRVGMVRGGPVDEQSQASVPVEDRVFSIEQVWKRKKIPAADIYAVLAGVVMPEARPGEMFLYARPLVYGVQQPRSVSQLLARWAAVAKREDDLKKRVATRQSLPL